MKSRVKPFWSPLFTRCLVGCAGLCFSFVTFAQTPNPPTSLTANAVSTNQIDLSWVDNSSNETGFKVERAPDVSGSPGTWAQIAVVGADVTTYSDMGAAMNTAYWYRVRAYRGPAHSSYSNQVTVEIVPPIAPSGLTATGAPTNQIDLSWLDNSPDEVGFKIERAPDSSGSPGTWSQIAVVSAGITANSDTGLSANTVYWYRVRAYNGSGDSAYSSQASAITPSPCPSPRLVVGWGGDWVGQATPPAGLTGVVAIAAGYEQSLALKSDGTVVAWGADEYGQTNVPPGLTHVVAIGAGIYHNLALKSDGTVVGWGDNTYNQITPPPGLSGVVSIAAGWYHNLALKGNGTVAGWGYGGNGETAPPLAATNVVAIAAGYEFSLAVKSDGTVVGFGRNNMDQTSVPVGLTGVVAVAAGYQHSLALKSDGTVVAWGDNTYGQTNVPVGLTGVVAIAADYSGNLALKSDGTVVNWGSNSSPPGGLAGVVSISYGFFHGLALTLPCSLSAPSSLTAVAIATNQINLSWLDNSPDEAGFKIERAPDVAGSPGTWTQIVTVGANVATYSDPGVATNTTYWYRVRAYKGVSNSFYSNQASVGIKPPVAPSGLTATAVARHEVDLSWSDNSPDELTFKIERALDAGGSPGFWTQIATVGADVTNSMDKAVTATTTYWYRVRAHNSLGDSAYSAPASATVTTSFPDLILDDTFAYGTRTIQDPPTRSAWWSSSVTHGPLSATVGRMTLGVDGSSSLIITYFTPDANSPPVLVNVGDTLTATINFVFDGIPTNSSSSVGFKIGLFNFADSTLNPKRVSADSSFSSSSQGNGVQGYALFGKMYTQLADTNPMDIRKRTNVPDPSLLGASGDWTVLASGPGSTNGFGGFANQTPYSLQFVLHRTSLNSMAITETWSNMTSGATLSVTTNDDSASNFSFDGIAYRPQNFTQAPATNQFNEVKIVLTSVPVAPSIVTQPQDLSISSGHNATFTVVPNGTLPLLYQWYFNTNTPVANATNATLTITNAQPADAGGYSIVISNSYGSVTSVVAQLAVSVAPPLIVTQPQDLNLIPGQTATFNVTVIGSEPFSYQWYYNTSTLLTNATASTLTLTNVQASDAGSYSVFISNPIGSITSSNAILAVNTNSVAPLFITQPASITVLPGNDASFTAFALGTQPITYQWNKNGVPLLGATSTILNLVNVQLPDAGTYTVTASNSVGSTVSTTAVLTVSVRMSPPLPVIPTNQFNILNFGASGDGVLNNATAIQNTIITAALAGGGTVEIPANGTFSTYLSGPIVLSNNVNLQVDGGATLKMLQRASWPGTLPPFITANNRHDVAITGSGTIDGNAGYGSSDWWPNLDTAHRPDFINFDGACSRVLIQGVTLRNPPAFHLMLKGNNVGVTIQNIIINTDPDSPNTDGMDLASTNVLIQNCSISCGDDNIEIGGSGGAAADVTVSNCTFGTGHGVSIGSITSGKVHDLLVSNCTFNGTDYGIRMKSDRTIGGVVENLKYYDISMTNVGYPIVIYSYYNEFGTPNNITPTVAIANGAQAVIDTTPIWRNIIISNLTATGTTGSRIGGIIWGRPEMVVSNLTLNRVNILAPTNTFNIYHARGIRIIDSNLTAPNTTTNTLNLYNAEVTITNSAVSTNLVTLGGLATPPTNNVVDFFNALVAITDTNMLGSSPVTLGDTTLKLTGPVSFSNDLTVASASTVVFTGGNNTFGSALNGPGPFSVILTNGSSLRFDQGTNVWGVNGGFDGGASGTINNHSGGAITILLGALSGGSGSMLRGSDQTGPGVDTYVVGGLNSNTTFAGTITDGTSGGTPHTVALTKVGSGTFTLTGANSYGGGTTVSNGTLLINNGAGSGTGNGALTIVSGATLGGSGAIGGPVTLNGTLAPGNSAGTLAINNSLVVDGAAILEYELGTNSDRTTVSGNLTLGGTLNITDAGGFTNGAYTLFTYGGTLTYGGVTVGTTPSTNFVYLIDTSTAGQVKLNVLLLPTTILADAGNLFDRLGTLAPSNSVAVLVVDTGHNGFVDPQPGDSLQVGATWGTDDRVIGLWDLSAVAADFGDGQLYDQVVMAYAGGVAPGQKVQLYWFPSLTLASNTVGVTYYGKYTDTNNPALDGSDVWELPEGDSFVHFKFWTAFWGGSNPETAGWATNLTASALTAFQGWQMQYFGDTNSAAGAANADPDGDGMNNNAEFLSGTDPTNSASAFRITAVVRESNDVRVTWTMGSGKTNALQASAGAGNGGYTTNSFSDIFTVTNTVGLVTNYLDVGAGTNSPARYYRVRLVP